MKVIWIKISNWAWKSRGHVTIDFFLAPVNEDGSIRRNIFLLGSLLDRVQLLLESGICLELLGKSLFPYFTASLVQFLGRFIFSILKMPKIKHWESLWFLDFRGYSFRIFNIKKTKRPKNWDGTIQFYEILITPVTLSE